MTSVLARWVFAPTFALCTLVCAGAGAQENAAPDPPEKPGIAEEAKAAFDRGDVQQACKLYEKAAELEPSSAILLASGQCHDLLGKTATAYREYTQASVLAQKEENVERADRARELASRLAPRLSKLRVDVQTPRPEQVVRKNGAPVDATTWGSLVAVDPGTYSISSSAPGFADFTTTVVVKGEADAQIVIVPTLQVQAAVTTPIDPGTPVVLPPANTSSPIGIAAFVTTSFGAVGIAMGTVFGIMSLNEKANAEDDPLLCPNKQCTHAGIAVVDEARTKATISTVAFSVGGVALATGVTLFLIKEFVIEKGDDPAAPPAVTVKPSVGLGAADVTFRF